MGVFKKLSELNVNDKVDKKKELSYLSWAWAWSKVKTEYPDATYTVWKDKDGNPYTYNSTLGYMCYTTVCIDGETLEMWLPVMNGANKAMLCHEYTYNTKYGEKTVAAATMFDINKTIMRCLVKNLAMFGLGLYIYAGEDLPEMDCEELLNDCKTLDELKKIYSSLSKSDQTKYASLKDELKLKLK